MNKLQINFEFAYNIIIIEYSDHAKTYEIIQQVYY